MVWMRTAARSTFRNLYGRIGHDLAASARLKFNVTASEYSTTYANKVSRPTMISVELGDIALRVGPSYV